MKTVLSKKKYIIMAVAIVCVLCITAIIFMGGNKEFKNHLSLGNKYLQEMKYEEAIVEFTAAFNLEPKNKEAAEGIENACLAYADSVLADVENVEIKTFVKVSEVLMSSYEITRIETIHSKAEEIEQVIQEKEEAQAEEEAKAAEEKAAEDAKKKEEEEKKKEEQAKKKELEEYYKWKAEQIWGNEFEYIEIICKEEDTEYILYVSGGATVCERIVVVLNKATETGVVSEHLVEDFENGGMRDKSANSRFVGKEYDFSSEEEIIIYREWVIEQERISQFVDSAMEQMIEHINLNWQLARDRVASFEEITLYYEDDSETKRYGCLKYISGNDSVFDRYYINVEVDLINQWIKIVECQKHIYEENDISSEEIFFDFETTIDIVVVE